MNLTNGYGNTYHNYNIAYMQKLAKKQGYNLKLALHNRVDMQASLLDRINGLESILQDLIRGGK